MATLGHGDSDAEDGNDRGKLSKPLQRAVPAAREPGCVPAHGALPHLRLLPPQWWQSWHLTAVRPHRAGGRAPPRRSRPERVGEVRRLCPAQRRQAEDGAHGCAGSADCSRARRDQGGLHPQHEKLDRLQNLCPGPRRVHGPLALGAGPFGASLLFKAGNSRTSNLLCGGVGYSTTGDAASAGATPLAELPEAPTNTWSMLAVERASALGDWIAKATSVCAANRTAVDEGVSTVDTARDAGNKSAHEAFDERARRSKLQLQADKAKGARQAPRGHAGPGPGQAREAGGGAGPGHRGARRGHVAGAERTGQRRRPEAQDPGQPRDVAPDHGSRGAGETERREIGVLFSYPAIDVYLDPPPPPEPDH